MLRSITEHNKKRSVYGDKHDEHQYLNLINDIQQHGTWEETRNGRTQMIFGAAMHYALTNHTVPLLTTKKLAWKTCLKELLWFIKGSTNNAELTAQNVHIWTGNARRLVEDASGLGYIEGADLGPIYGHQWRHFNAPYDTCYTDYTGQGVDQLANIVSALKDPAQRSSRRLVMSAWNPCQLSQMALPPCHVMCQFNVRDGRYLSCHLYQRSADVGLGMPFNIASYSFLTHLLAHHCGLEAEDFNYSLGNCHIYDDHVEALTEQTKRDPFPFPTLRIAAVKEKLEDYVLSDFIVENYRAHDAIVMQMRP
jgi:thymidylate synthase